MSVDVDTHEVDGHAELAAATLKVAGSTNVYDDLEHRAEARIAEIIASQGKAPLPRLASLR
jgi:hypothetical protein